VGKYVAFNVAYHIKTVNGEIECIVQDAGKMKETVTGVPPVTEQPIDEGIVKSDSEPDDGDAV